MLAWLCSFCCLDIRYERRADRLEGFVLVANSLICVRFLQRAEVTYVDLRE